LYLWLHVIKPRQAGNLIIVIYIIIISTVISFQSADEPPEPNGLPPCGEVCTYGGRVTEIPGNFFLQRRKRIECNNIMKRMAYRGHPVIFPPPTYPPANLIDEFTMFGDMPISKMWYFDANWTAEPKTFSSIQMDTIIKSMNKGNCINMYQDNKCVQNMLIKYKNEIRGKSGVVIGTELPWLEGLVLGYGAGNVTTLEYATITTELPNMAAYTPYDYADKYLKGEVKKFDFAASFSSIEHSGLGRYTDPLNPYGDLEAMAQTWCMIKPGGLFVLGLPCSMTDDGFILWNANRMYGTKRLQQMTANWRLLEVVRCTDANKLFVLRKPAQQQQQEQQQQLQLHYDYSEW